MCLKVGVVFYTEDDIYIFMQLIAWAADKSLTP